MTTFVLVQDQGQRQVQDFCKVTFFRRPSKKP